MSDEIKVEAIEIRKAESKVLCRRDSFLDYDRQDHRASEIYDDATLKSRHTRSENTEIPERCGSDSSTIAGRMNMRNIRSDCHMHRERNSETIARCGDAGIEMFRPSCNVFFAMAVSVAGLPAHWMPRFDRT